MGKKFSDEVAYIPQSVAWAIGLDTQFLAHSLSSLASKNVICIGSGGSTTVALFLAQLHEAKYGLASKIVTPCEFLLQKHQLYNTAVVLVSAEGKNQDILAVAEKATLLEIPCVAIVLSAESPLAQQCETSGSAVVHSFPMLWRKDGYLATNSLIAMLTILAKAYAVETVQGLGLILNGNYLESRRNLLVKERFKDKIIRHPFLTVLYGSNGKIGAVDIESKLSEAALFPCEITDYRQFAHGRHLQLTVENRTPCFISFYSASDKALCDATLDCFPKNISVIKLELPDDYFLAAVISVVDAILITELLANVFARDPGQPLVSELGRQMHHLDVKALLPTAKNLQNPIRRKCATNINENIWQAAAESFCNSLRNTTIRAIVCDFDGTFCNTELRHKGLDLRLVATIEQLAKEGVTFGFATGRGRSLHKDLRAKLSSSVWSKIFVGYYSGSIVIPLEQTTFEPPEPDIRFKDLVQWLTENGLLAPEGCQTELKMHGGQLSILSTNHSLKPKIVAGIRFWLKENLFSGWRIFFSGHSIDVLTEGAGKAAVVSSIAKKLQCCPLTEIVRIGDAGEIEGNDFELLKDGLGLSVDKVSPFKSSCWNLLPTGYRGAVGTLFYLKGIKSNGDGKSARFNEQILEEFDKAVLGDNEL